MDPTPSRSCGQWKDPSRPELSESQEWDRNDTGIRCRHSHDQQQSLDRSIRRQAIVGGIAPSDLLIFAPYRNSYTSYASIGQVQGGGVPGGRGQLYMQLNAAVDAAYYFNPVQRYTVHNAAASRPYQAVFETGVEGCYNDASDFVASGPCAPYFGYHWYLYNNVTGTTALDVNGLGYLSFGYPAVALSGITSTQYLTEVGAATASASTIAPLRGIFHVSGNATISMITPPAGMSPAVGGCLSVIADGTWSTANGGNISTAMTASVGSLYSACYDGSRWYLK